MKKILTFLFSCFIGLTLVSADSVCDYNFQAELNAEAANVKVNYEIREEKTQGTYGEFSYDYFAINFLNITDNIYVEVKNNYNGETFRINSSDTNNGMYEYKWAGNEEIVTFTISVYGSTVSKCPLLKLKTLYLTLPRFNKYSEYDMCLDNQDYYLCKKYVTFTDIDEDEFIKSFESYVDGFTDKKGEEIPKEEKFVDKTVAFIKDYKWFLIGGATVLAAGGFILYRKSTKKQRELGL